MKQLIIEESCAVAFISEKFLQLLFLDSSIRQRVTMSQRSVIKSYKREEGRQRKSICLKIYYDMLSRITKFSY